VGNPYEQVIPLSTSGLKTLIKEYNSLMQFSKLKGVMLSQGVLDAAASNDFTLPEVILENCIQTPAKNLGKVVLKTMFHKKTGDPLIMLRYDFTRAINHFSTKPQNVPVFTTICLAPETLTYLMRDVLPIVRCLDDFQATGMRLLCKRFNLEMPKMYMGHNRQCCISKQVPGVSIEWGINGEFDEEESSRLVMDCK
jgi:hypothetical protein